MGSLTDHVPKPLLQVGGQPLIVRLIEQLRRANFCELVINLAYRGEQIRAALGHGQTLGVNIRYVLEPPGALETGGGIFNALSWLEGDAFLVTNGDVWTDFPFTRLAMKPSGYAHLVLVHNPPHHPQGDFALINGMIAPQAEGRLTFGGIGVYRPELFAPCVAGRFPLAPLLHAAAERGLVTGELYGGKWVDVGTPERLRSLDRQLLRKNKDGGHAPRT